MRTLPEKISEQQIDGHMISRDEAGYLMEPDDWSKEVALKFAEEEGVELSDEHWLVLEFMRNYLEEHNVAADARFVFKYLADLHSENKNEGRQRFFELFPYGYTKQACKIAGMRQPRAWSTG